MSLLAVQDVSCHFNMGKRVGVLRAVDGVSFEIDKGETFALVGESVLPGGISFTPGLYPDPVFSGTGALFEVDFDQQASHNGRLCDLLPSEL